MPGCLYWATRGLAASGNIQAPGYTTPHAGQPGYRRHARKTTLPLTRTMSERRVTVAGVTVTVGYNDYGRLRLPCFKESDSCNSSFFLGYRKVLERVRTMFDRINESGQLPLPYVEESHGFIKNIKNVRDGTGPSQWLYGSLLTFLSILAYSCILRAREQEYQGYSRISRVPSQEALIQLVRAGVNRN